MADLRRHSDLVTTSGFVIGLGVVQCSVHLGLVVVLRGSIHLGLGVVLGRLVIVQLDDGKHNGGHVELSAGGGSQQLDCLNRAVRGKRRQKNHLSNLRKHLISEELWPKVRNFLQLRR